MWKGWRRWRLDLPALAAIAAATAWHVWILRGHYHGFQMAFTDVDIINDWFTNALYAGRPFWVTDLGISHMSVHFTPTLLALIPFYLLTQSQFLIALLGPLAMAAALYLGHRLVLRLLRRRGVAEATAVAASVVLILFVSLNPYVKSVLNSVHIEPLEIPLALGMLCLLIETERWTLAAVLLALALGVREDSGVYLCMQCLALAFVPRELFRNRPAALRRAAVFAAASLAWTVLVARGINPWVFGVHENHVRRGWARWGSSWPEVAWHLATRPGELLAALGHSAVLPFNGWFGLAPWLVHPLFGLAVNVPGVPLWAAEPIDKRMLWFYNASFLLPGFLLGLYLAVDRGAVLARRLAAAHPRWALRPAWQAAAVAVAGALALVLPLSRLDDTVEWHGRYAREFGAQVLADDRAITHWLRRCPPLTAVATDFRRIVLLPNRTSRYLLRHAADADVVLLFRPADPELSGVASAEAVWHLLEGDRDFVLRRETGRFRIYTRPGVRCVDPGDPPEEASAPGTAPPSAPAPSPPTPTPTPPAPSPPAPTLAPRPTAPTLPAPSPAPPAPRQG